MAVAAARLGFAPVRAVDYDDVAVEVTAETARANGVELEVARADVLRDEIPDADVVVANIELTVVEALLDRSRGASRRDVGLPGRRTAARAGVDPRSAR